ncbi:hypothetical protein ACPCTO_35735 [Streptomyces olivoreticuli]
MTEHPMRDALVLLVLGLAGPVAVLHQKIGGVLDGPADGPSPAAAAADTVADGEP